MSSFEPPVGRATDRLRNPPGSGGTISPLQAIYIEDLLHEAYPYSAVANIERHFRDTWDPERELSTMASDIGGWIIGALKSGNSSKIKIIDTKLISPQEDNPEG